MVKRVEARQVKNQTKLFFMIIWFKAFLAESNIAASAK